MILLSENLINTAYPRAFCLVPTKWISLSKWLRKFKRLNFIDKIAVISMIGCITQITVKKRGKGATRPWHIYR